jgi:predicted AlkP superfamily pyrophosphatase or phosphodiesterase
VKTARKTLFFVAILLAVLLLAVSVAAAQPKRVLIVVMDQMQPGYAQQFHMKNVLWLQHHGVTFPNAMVGDMASETVVSHNVMVSGQFPKHMGWSDEAFRDVGNVLGFGAGSIVTSGDLGFAQYEALIQAAGDYPKLGDYLHAAFPGTVVANVGEKGYQVESMAAESSDWYVRMGSKGNTADLTAPFSPSSVPWSGTYRGPSGKVPDYITNDPRYLVSVGNSSDTYGTELQYPSWLYSEDGRYVPSEFQDHQSGDIWVADAATAIMEHENWSGLWVTFSAIDKIGHMWGGGAVDTVANYGWDPNSIYDWVHMPFAAKNADEQLGKLIAELKKQHQFKDTLIVLTADHGSTYGEHFYGDQTLGAGEDNWEAGTWYPGSTTPSTSPGSATLQPLLATGNVLFSYQSTAMETWLIDQSWKMKVEAAKVMAKLPGVIATYVKSEDGDSYVLQCTRTSTRMTWAERAWWLRHGQQLVNTMAWQGSADVVGLLADRTSYGVYGDHGGAQKDVQRIPMAIYNPSIRHVVNCSPMRLVDIMPTALRAMGIPLTAPVDGRAYKLPVWHVCHN